MKKLLVLIMLSAAAFSACAYEVVTSEFVGKQTDIKHSVTVILPESYDKARRYNTIYVLHGYSGNHADWTTKSDIENLADEYNVIIVNPDGNYESWYIDSNIKKDSRYETYIAKDVVNYIDQNYATNTNRNGRAITGLSMGGFGALHIAMNHQDLFGAVGAMSAGVDLRPYAEKTSGVSVLGDYERHPENWTNIATINNLHKLAAGEAKDALPIVIDIGVDDFFLPVNRQLHQAMLARDIRHEYIEQPGGHDWAYWNHAIVYQFQFLTRHLAQ